MPGHKRQKRTTAEKTVQNGHMPQPTPISAWKSLRDGNERFVTGTVVHPSQSVDDRAKLVSGQRPSAILFGCGDSRVAAEIIFDRGLGDMFVVRTAGHVVDESVLGSIEYGVHVLEVPLIVVLGHDSCGAVKATLDALDRGMVPAGYIRSLVERVAPSVLMGRREGLREVDELEARHVVETGRLLVQRSSIIAERVASGQCAVACVTYQLDEGKVKLHKVMGEIGENADVQSVAESSAA